MRRFLIVLALCATCTWLVRAQQPQTAPTTPPTPPVKAAQATPTKPAAAKPTPFTLTIDNIMRGQKLIGSAPTSVRRPPDRRWRGPDQLLTAHDVVDRQRERCRLGGRRLRRCRLRGLHRRRRRGCRCGLRLLGANQPGAGRAESKDDQESAHASTSECSREQGLRDSTVRVSLSP